MVSALLVEMWLAEMCWCEKWCGLQHCIIRGSVGRVECCSSCSLSTTTINDNWWLEQWVAMLTKQVYWEWQYAEHWKEWYLEKVAEDQMVPVVEGDISWNVQPKLLKHSCIPKTAICVILVNAVTEYARNTRKKLHCWSGPMEALSMNLCILYLLHMSNIIYGRQCFTMQRFWCKWT